MAGRTYHVIPLIGRHCHVLGYCAAVLLQVNAVFADERHALRIPAAPANVALKELSRQSGYPVIFRTREVTDVRTNAVVGEFTIRNALDVMFEGTRLVGGLSLEEVVTVSSRDQPTGNQETNMSPNRVRKSLLARVAAPVTALAAALLAAPTAAEPAERGVEQGEDAEDRTEEIVVVGTRLAKGDPTARVVVIDFDEIKALGAATAEEIVRTLPQNFAGFNRFSAGVFSPDLAEFDESVSFHAAFGSATANLLGLGSSNTLVLVNGKRVAGLAGEEGLFANIRHIPASAIERVEVHLDGGSAIFGSEAAAGVINFVLRDDYVGIKLNTRVEHSSTGGHARNASAFAGYHWTTPWGAGTATVLASFDEREPVDAHRAGFTSRDHRARYGGDERYNFVPGQQQPRSGAVGFSFWGPRTHILPPGDDGRDVQFDDFDQISDADFLDIVARDSGGLDEDRSYTLSIRQEIGPRLAVDAEAVRTAGETRHRLQGNGMRLDVPPSNAFNNFGQWVFVTYYPHAEIESGLVGHPVIDYRGDVWRYLVGLEYQPRDGIVLHVDYAKSRSTADSEHREVSSYSNYAFGTTDEYEADRAGYFRFDELVASDDPGTAINLFGDGSGQNPTLADLYRRVSGNHGTTHVESMEGFATIDVIGLPAGTLGLVIGGERRREWVEQSLAADDIYLGATGTSDPKREFSSAFAEIRVPVVSGGDAFGLHTLTLSGQVHYDRYSSVGGIGGMEDVILGKSKFSNASKRFGILWAPVDGVAVRASRSEAFRPPLFTELFRARENRYQRILWDPLLSAPDFLVQGFEVHAASPDLRPEHSSGYSAGIDWRPARIPGLAVAVDWSEIDYRDRVVRSTSLAGLLPLEVYGNMDFFVRDDDGTLREQVVRYVNISRRYVESASVEVSYGFSTPMGSFDASVDYHRVFDLFEQAFAGTEQVGYVGRSMGLDRYKVRGRLNWVREPYGANLWVNYTPSYTNDSQRFYRIPAERVASYTTVDITGTYKMDNGFSFRFGGRNILDADFPFALNYRGLPWDPRRVDLRKRVLFLEAEYDFDLF